MTYTLNSRRLHMAILGKMERVGISADQLCTQLGIAPEVIGRLAASDENLGVGELLALTDWLQIPTLVFVDGPRQASIVEQLDAKISELTAAAEGLRPGDPRRAVTMAAIDTFTAEKQTLAASPIGAGSLPWRLRLPQTDGADRT